MERSWLLVSSGPLLAAAAGAAAAQTSDQAAAAPAQPATPPLAGGKATIRCVVVAHNRLDKCTVLSEEPPGSGFGEMALSMSKEMRFNGPVDGLLTIPIAFKKPASPSPR
jgi:hypothetical protein